MSEEKVKFPTEIIELPSRGWVYPEDSPLYSGTVELKYPTATDEDILTSKILIQKGIVLDRFIESIFVGDSKLIGDMVLGDYDKVIMAARILAYGGDYVTNVICPNCGEKSESTINALEWDDKELDEDSYEKGENIFKFTLPTGGQVLTFKLLTRKDSRDIDIEMKRKKKSLGLKAVNGEITTRYKRMILEIDGDSNKSAISTYIEKSLLMRDSRAFRSYLATIAPSVITGHEFVCDECGHESYMEVPLDANFFWPSTN